MIKDPLNLFGNEHKEVSSTNEETAGVWDWKDVTKCPVCSQKMVLQVGAKGDPMNTCFDCKVVMPVPNN